LETREMHRYILRPPDGGVYFKGFEASRYYLKV
jgi:hypothetical protein